MSESFALHPRLAADTAFLCDWALCRVLLMNDARFPWLILVPRRTDIVELFDLDGSAQQLLTTEAARAAEALKRWAEAEKINIGALGNLVPQFHLHVVARRISDAAWPGPVWGAGTPERYRNLNTEAAKLQQVLAW